MFKNTGKTIRVLAAVMLILQSLGCVITGIVWWVDEDFWLGLIFMLGGPLASAIINLFISAFGELVENSSVIAARLNGTVTPAYASNPAQSANRPASAQTATHTAPAASATNASDTLKSLLDQGLITEQEYKDALKRH